MASLSNVNRKRIWRGLMRWWSQQEETVAGVNKIDLRAAVDATDGWIDANAASYNSALPEPARSSLTAGQKTLIFVAVALMRHDPEFLRRIVGEVD